MRKIKEMLHKHDNENDATLNTSSVDRTHNSYSSTGSNVIGSDLDRTHALPLSSSTTTTTTATVAEPLIKEHHHKTHVPLAPLRTSQERTVPVVPLVQPTVALESEKFVESQRIIHQEPVHVERVAKPMVVQERIHPIQKEEIQPVIHREREQLDVKQITEMLHETKINPTLVEQRELAPEIKAPVIMRGAPIMPNTVAPSTTVDAVKSSQVIHAPIVEETIKKTIIEEVQPVLERDVITPTVIKEIKPIYEKIIEAPHVERVFLPERELGVTGSSTMVETREFIRDRGTGLHPQQGLTEFSTTTQTTTFTEGSGLGLQNQGMNSGLQSQAFNSGLQNQGLKSFPGENLQQGSNLQKLNSELDRAKYPSTH